MSRLTQQFCSICFPYIVSCGGSKKKSCLGKIKNHTISSLIKKNTLKKKCIKNRLIIVINWAKHGTSLLPTLKIVINNCHCLKQSKKKYHYVLQSFLPTSAVSVANGGFAYYMQHCAPVRPLC